MAPDEPRARPGVSSNSALNRPLPPFLLLPLPLIVFPRVALLDAKVFQVPHVQVGVREVHQAIGTHVEGVVLIIQAEVGAATAAGVAGVAVAVVVHVCDQGLGRNASAELVAMVAITSSCN